MAGIDYHYPDALVSVDWLEHRLDDPNLRVFDCTTHLILDEGNSRPYRVVSGRTDFEAGHIPGSGHLDLQADFSVKESPYRFTLPPAEEVSKAFERHGIGDNTQVVLYSRKSLSWATRFWWMLRWLGFDSAAILDGGYDKWNTDGRPISTDPCRYPSGNLSIKPRPEIFVDKNEVLAGIDDSNVCSINALAPELFAGESARYGRPGRIPGSVSVPAMSLMKPGTLEVGGVRAKMLERAGDIS